MGVGRTETTPEERRGGRDRSPLIAGDASLTAYRALLGLLLHHAPVKRMRLVELTGATQPTVTRWIAELIAAGIVRELGVAAGESRPGRPAVLVDLVPDAAVAAALFVTRISAEVGLVNLKGQILGRRARTINPREPVDRSAVVEWAAEHLLTMVAQQSIPEHRLLGVGIGASGIVDADRGIGLQYSVADGRLVATEVDFAGLFARRLPWPVSLATNGSAMALGERWFGSRDTHCLLIYIDEGVGAGYVRDGLLHRGRGASGSAAHTKVPQANGMPCACGQQGCLAALVSRRGILSRLGWPDGATMREVVAAAQRGETAVLGVLSTCGEAIATACAPLVDLLGPDVVTLAGPLFEVPRVLDVMARELNHASFVGRLNGVRVLAASLGRDVGLIGAASLVYDGLVTGCSPAAAGRL